MAQPSIDAAQETTGLVEGLQLANRNLIVIVILSIASKNLIIH